MTQEDQSFEKSDEYWMKKALKLASRAALKGEVPVGAVLVQNGKAISWALNRREQLTSPLGHAELIVLQKASQHFKSWRLLDTTLYVTLEPCVMCAGAIQQARVSRVVFGAFDPKAGALHSLYKIGQDPRLNHRFDVVGGVMEHDCAQVLKDFFRARRLDK